MTPDLKQEEFYDIMRDIHGEVKAIRKIFDKTADALYLIAKTQLNLLELTSNLTARVENNTIGAIGVE